MLYEVRSVRRKHLAPGCSAVRGIVQPEAGRGEDRRARGRARGRRIHDDLGDMGPTRWWVEDRAAQLDPGNAAIRRSEHAAAVVTVAREMHLSGACIHDTGR